MKLTTELLDTWEKDCAGLPVQRSHTRLARAIPQIRRLLEIEARIKNGPYMNELKTYLLTGLRPAEDPVYDPSPHGTPWERGEK